MAFVITDECLSCGSCDPQKRKKGRLASLFFYSVLPPPLREDGDAREARDDPSLLAWPILREAVTEGVEKSNG